MCKGVTGASGDFLQSESCDADAAAVNLVAGTQFYCHSSGVGNLDGGKQCSTMLADLETLFGGTQLNQDGTMWQPVSMDFEYPTSNYIYDDAGNTFFPEWPVSRSEASNPLVVIRNGSPDWGGLDSESGDTFIGLKKATVSIERKLVSLVPGHVYKIGFLAACRPVQYGLSDDCKLTLSVDGVLLSDQLSPKASAFQHYDYNFTATSTAATIRFSNEGMAAGDITTFLDAVEIMHVPPAPVAAADNGVESVTSSWECTCADMASRSLCSDEAHWLLHSDATYGARVRSLCPASCGVCPEDDAGEAADNAECTDDDTSAMQLCKVIVGMVEVQDFIQDFVEIDGGNSNNNYGSSGATWGRLSIPFLCAFTLSLTCYF